MKVKDVFKISKGKKAIESNDSSLDRYIQIEDLRSDNVLKYAEPNTKNVLCDYNDVLIAWDGANAGTVGYNLKGVLGSTLAKLTPKIEDVYPKYAGRFLQSKFRYLRDNCTGATIPHISRPVLEGLKIPLPPLDQQKKIAEILDTADAYRQKTKALIEKYDALTQSLFLDMFGDPVTNPKGWKSEVLQKCLKKVDKIDKSYDKHKIDYVDIASIDNLSNVVTETTTYLTKDRPSRAQQILCSGDILFSTVRPNLKNIAINEIDGRIGTTGFFVCRTNSHLLSNYFLFNVFLTDSVTEYFVSMTSGANYPAIKSSEMKKFKVILPPLELQNQFAERVKAIEAQKAIAQQELKKADELFNSLLQKAFKGELV